MSHPLPGTLTPVSLTPGLTSMMHEPTPIWGKLLPTIRGLREFDLKKPCFLLGRDPQCDMVISEEMVSLKRLTSFSRKHFCIEQGADNLVYITDLSKNGTFLNKKLIGMNKKCILTNDDDISVSFKELRVYKYKSILNSEQSYLPIGLRKKYEVSKLLGEGACGEVRLVFDKYTCRPYACKRILKSAESRKFNRPENIRKEVNILRQLEHPFIISTKEVEETPEAFYIIMEYMEGGELSDLIHSPKRLEESRVKYLFYQIAIAVQYLHDKNITHRDLKPANILLKNNSKDDNMVKITDFGLSKMISQQTMMKTLCGTPYFAAPEILDPQTTTYGRKVDVWSLGVILYYMFAQEYPFSAPNTVALSKVILNGKYTMKDKLWTKVSETGKDLIRKMLVRDPKDRFNIDQVVEHSWFERDKPLRLRVNEILYTNFDTRPLEKFEGDSEESDDGGFHCSKRIKLSQEDDEAEQETSVD